MSKLWMRTPTAMTALCLVVLLPLSGCTKRSSATPNTFVRLVHTSTDLGPVDVYAKDPVKADADLAAGDFSDPGTLVFANIAFNDVTGNATLPLGAYRLIFRTAGSSPLTSMPPLFTSQDLLLAANERRTTVLAGFVSSTLPNERLRLLDFTENFSPNAFPLARVRVVNASTDAPPLLLDTNDDGTAETPIAEQIRRFEAGPEAGENLPVFDLNLGLIDADTSMPIESFRFSGLDRSDQYFLIVTGLLSEPSTSPTALNILVVGRNDPIGSVRPNPALYFLQGSPSESTLTLSLDGSPVVVDAPYGELQGPIKIVPGTKSISIDGAMPFATATTTIAAGRDVLIVAAGTAGAMTEVAQAVVLTDEFAIDPLSAQVRFTHLNPDLATVNFGLVDTGAFVDPILFEDAQFAISSPAAGEPLPAMMADYGFADSTLPAPTNIYLGIPTTLDMRAFFLLMGNTDGSQQPSQVFQIITNTEPWTLMKFDD